MSGYGTAWQETEAFLSVQHSLNTDDDTYAEARAILADCSAAELSELADVAGVLANLCRNMRREKRLTAAREESGS